MLLTIMSRKNNLPLITLLCLWVSLTSCTSSLHNETKIELRDNYTNSASHPTIQEPILLAAGDKISIDVWGIKDLSKKITINSTGYIQYPFIGRIKAAGKTVTELQELVTKKLSRYYISPQVTVMPISLASQKCYILGEINQPGILTMTSKLSPMEAVASVGGLTQDAESIIFLLRKRANHLSVFSIPLKFNNLTTENTSSLTMQVQPNDILYIPPSNIANLERFMNRLNNMLNPLLSIERGIMYWPEMQKALDGGSSDILIPIQ